MIHKPPKTRGEAPPTGPRRVSLRTDPRGPIMEPAGEVAERLKAAVC